MLKLVVNGDELWDEKSQEFITVRGQTLMLEYSLKSISKWEEKWKKSYLDKNTEKTPEEALDFIRCMTINNDVDPMVYRSLTPAHYEQIYDYIADPHTATTFREDDDEPKSRKVITAEIIYYQMSALNIPFEWGEKQNFNKLMTLIRVCALKSAPPKKNKGGKKRNSAAARRELNRKRLSETGTSG